MQPRIHIELFTSAHCNRCDKAKAQLQNLIYELGCDRFAYRVVDIVGELDYVVELGVLNTTAITIEGELVFSSMPSKKKLRDALRKRLDTLSP